MTSMLREFNVRLATSCDIDTILDLANKTKEFDKIGFLTRNDLDYCINVKRDAKFYVAIGGKSHKVIGFIYGFVEVPSFACLMYICVDKKWRNIGVGKELVDSFLIDMKGFGVQKIYCLTTTENVSIFFSNCGFTYGEQLLGYMEIKSNEIPKLGSDKQ